MWSDRSALKLKLLDSFMYQRVLKRTKKPSMYNTMRRMNMMYD
jgi:hypothetical protein